MGNCILKKKKNDDKSIENKKKNIEINDENISISYDKEQIIDNSTNKIIDVNIEVNNNKDIENVYIEVPIDENIDNDLEKNYINETKMNITKKNCYENINNNKLNNNNNKKKNNILIKGGKIILPKNKEKIKKIVVNSQIEYRIIRNTIKNRY